MRSLLAVGAVVVVTVICALITGLKAKKTVGIPKVGIAHPSADENTVSVKAKVAANASAKDVADAEAERKEFELLKAKATEGDAKAQMEIGEKYELGITAQKNQPEALKWYLKAANQGNSDALFKIGGMHALGEGVPRDQAEALRWYLEAANH